MYNPHNYAVEIEHLLKVPYNSAGEIEKNPLAYISSFLDKLAERSDEKQQQVFAFDDKYKKYEDMPFMQWKESDAVQMVKDLRELFR